MLRRFNYKKLFLQTVYISIAMSLIAVTMIILYRTGISRGKLSDDLFFLSMITVLLSLPWVRFFGVRSDCIIIESGQLVVEKSYMKNQVIPFHDITRVLFHTSLGVTIFYKTSHCLASKVVLNHSESRLLMRTIKRNNADVEIVFAKSMFFPHRWREIYGRKFQL